MLTTIPALPKRVEIVEVGPRDGLQNEKTMVPTVTKVELIDRLTAAGLGHIEATAFVSPKWVPQMADAAAVVQQIQRSPATIYSALVPNLQGFETALSAGVSTVAVFVAASESFSRRNINCSIAESLERIQPVLAAAKAQNIGVRGYISCVIACPYEGPVAPEQVAAVAKALWDLGVYEISLGDTIGVGTPTKVQRMIASVQKIAPEAKLAGHFHDTYGQALVNVYASLLMGINTFDASVGGLGGCPYAPGASGNLATEDLVYLLEGCGIATGIDLEALQNTSAWIGALLQRQTASRVTAAWLARQQKN